MTGHFLKNSAASPTGIHAERDFDLIVIGGGINGAGVAREAAMRGLRVLLVEKSDLSAGTSAWSTRLIHGGLRYLEHMEFPLVRESLRERERLLHTAPHLVRPLPLLIPVYQGARHGMAMLRLGMMAYDVLSVDKSLPHHRMLAPAAAMRRCRGLRPESLRGAALYYDAQVTFAERLVVENALSARSAGAIILTHSRVEEILLEGGKVRGVRVAESPGGQSRRYAAPVVVNAAGPWLDAVARLGDPAGRRLVGATRGSHIVTPPLAGAGDDGVYVEAHADGRPFFILPWNGLQLIGTTDIRDDGDPDTIFPAEGEIAYLVAETNRVLPSARLKREDVLYAYSGLRPLPQVLDRAEGDITRRHIIHDHAPAARGLISLVGGKLTTYRSLAEQVTDRVMRMLGRPAGISATATTPLPGGGETLADVAASLRADGRLSRRSADHLLNVYGTRATEVMEIAARSTDLLEVFDPFTGAIGAEVVMAFERELAGTLGDALLRRTMVGLGPTRGIGADERAAAMAHRHLGWPRDRVAGEVAGYRRR